VWGIRASDVDHSTYGWYSSLVFMVGAWLSRFPDLIIVNSEAGRRHHIARGYCGDHMKVIHNGVDSSRFRPDEEAGDRCRREWGISRHLFVIGIVARLDPMKDHRNFLRAAAMLARQRDDVRFVCVGTGSPSVASSLREIAVELGVDGIVTWLGQRTDLPAVYNGFDLATSASAFGEGFSNAIAEAMACGIPCVATNVGDAAIIMGDTGRIVPPGDSQALCSAWNDLYSLDATERAILARRARVRIVENFSLEVFRRESLQAIGRLCESDETNRTRMVPVQS